ncbi:hypothetical protein [Brevibacillus brevis]|uniref:Uncharacterized protein n=1 Tax=Brevibacillus brevis TaxID=1393 RepID=A0A517I0R7_BREBE|nr:hypothetical protein [Brevibacillus brevis]QDS32499.1 hypothetical protein FPS98_00050 [Brevibacillus brevis]
MAVMKFTYDPIFITKTLLQSYVEKFVQGKFYKAKQFACYEFLRTMTDEELEGMLKQYMKDHSIECITFEKAWEECALIFEYVYKSERYKGLEFGFKKRGYGLTGMGVVDKSDSTFYDCGFLQHWSTIFEIMKEKYTDKAEALDELLHRPGKEEYNGISRVELDGFILERFELIGGNKDIEFYLD